MSCARCPCPTVCLQLPAFCVWMAREPTDPVQVLHIIEVSHAKARGPADPASVTSESEPAPRLGGCCGGA